MKVSDKLFSEDYWQGRLVCATVTLLLFEPIFYSIAQLFGFHTSKFTITFGVLNIIMMFYLTLYVIGCFEEESKKNKGEKENEK